MSVDVSPPSLPLFSLGVLPVRLSVSKFLLKLYLFIYLFNCWLCWVFMAARAFSLVLASGGYSPVECKAFSLQGLLLWQTTGSRALGLQELQHGDSVVVACRLPRALTRSGTRA